MFYYIFVAIDFMYKDYTAEECQFFKFCGKIGIIYSADCKLLSILTKGEMRIITEELEFQNISY